MGKADEWLEKAEKELSMAKEEGHVTKDVIELVSELRIHQSELEMQNEELKESQTELSNVYNQYHELFDDAPVGYFTLNKQGIIRNVNIKGSELLQLRKEIIIGRGFSQFIPKIDENKYFNALAKAIDSCNIQKLEIQLKRNNSLFYAHMEIMPLKRDEESYRIIITDITDRKNVEEFNQAIQARFRAVLDNSRDVIYRLNMQTGYYEYISPSAEDVVGFKPKELMGLNAEESLEMIHPDDRNILQEAIKNLEDSGEFEVEYRQQTKNGDYVWISNHMTLTKDSIGRPLYRDGNIRDITERKKAEEGLKESKERYRSLTENIDSVLMRYDKDLQVIYLSPKAKEITGVSTEEFIGKTNREVGMPEGLCDLWENAISEVFQTCEMKALEFNIATDEGEKTFYLKLSPEFNPDGSVSHVLGISTDITELKKAEEELKQAHDHLEEKVMERTRELNITFESITDAVVIYDKNLNVLKSNDGVKEFSMDASIFKGDYNTRLEKNKWFLSDGTPMTREKAPPTRAQQGETVKNVEVYIEASSGIRWLRLSAAPLYDENGVLFGVVQTFNDITEIKKSEKELKELLNKLERSNKELQQFAYVSSHDLQEPLRTIASFSQLLERRYKGKLDSDADEFIDFIVEAAKRMKQQIQDLLEFSRVETKGGKLEPVDMNLIANQVVQSLNSSIGECNAEIVIDELPTVTSDAGQLQRVFQNLISNALKFRKPDKPPRIHISAYKSENGSEYVFSVSDNGIGIEEEYSERIFVIFQRLHTMSEYRGTGIGLSIVKRIIERHGGHVWVESEFGKGSTFYFTIPIKQNKAILT